MNTISRKTTNRVKGLLGSIGVGEKIDLGKPHAKGYRITCGRTSAGIQARFWLGHDHTAAQQRANVIVNAWATMTSTGISAWTPELIAQAKAIGDQSVEAAKPFIASVREEAVRGQQHVNRYIARNADLLGTAATPAPVAPTLPERSQAGPSLYDAIKAYLEALKGKRVSEGHRWRAEQVLERTLKGVRADVPLAKIDYLWLDTLADHFKSRPLSKKSVEDLIRLIAKGETSVTEVA
jgi:hypothetical protein